MNVSSALFHAPGTPLELRAVPVPVPGPGEALVRVRCCTLCGSDLHTIRGARSAKTPTVLGHEIVGTVSALGSGGAVDVDGQPLAPGDRVVWSLVVACGTCANCARGREALCTRRFKYGHEPFADAPFSGGLAEVCLLVRGTAIVRVPDVLSDEVAATASCAGATVMAALAAAGGVEGDHVAILGAGLLGLTAAAFAREDGARRVFLVDPVPERLSRAGAVGAEPIEDWNELRTFTPEGVDVVLELSGAAPAVAAGLDLLGVGGRLVLVGSVFPGPDVAVSPERLVRRRVRIAGVHNYAPEDLRSAVQRLAASAAPFASWIGQPVALSEVDAAVARGLTGEELRAAVRPR